MTRLPPLSQAVYSSFCVKKGPPLIFPLNLFTLSSIYILSLYLPLKWGIISCSLPYHYPSSFPTSQLCPPLNFQPKKTYFRQSLIVTELLHPRQHSSESPPHPLLCCHILPTAWWQELYLVFKTSDQGFIKLDLILFLVYSMPWLMKALSLQVIINPISQNFFPITFLLLTFGWQVYNYNVFSVLPFMKRETTFAILQSSGTSLVPVAYEDLKISVKPLQSLLLPHSSLR